MNVDFVARKSNHFFRNRLILDNYLRIEFAEKSVFDGRRAKMNIAIVGRFVASGGCRSLQPGVAENCTILRIAI